MPGRPLLNLLALSTVLLFLPSSSQHHRPSGGALLAQAPHVMLWAWERPERMIIPDNADIGVSYLAETIFLRKDRFVRRPRMQSLKVDKCRFLEAVVHMESDRDINWNPSDEQLNLLASDITGVANRFNAQSLQIDFDAKETERPAYRRLLKAVREKLPKNTTLSMTALASWCMGDRWIGDAPVDQVVPMLFSMGAGTKEAFNYIATSKFGGLSYFQKCVGLSITDSTSYDLLAKRAAMKKSRIYFFSGCPWNPTLIEKAQREVQKWQSGFGF